MRLSDYDKIQSLSQADTFVLDTQNGTKSILAVDIAKSLLDLTDGGDILKSLDLTQDDLYDLIDPIIPVELRRNFFRGKNLGSVVTDEMYDEIDAGTFKGLFLGDYWEIGGRIWRIMDFDYWFGQGDTACNTHHLVIMPDHALYNAAMNDTNVTTGAYVGSKMYTTNLTEAKTIVNGAFTAAHILNHREYLQNAVTSGYASAGAWFDSTIELPNEPMMYGSYIFTPAGDGTVVVNRYTIDKTQLAGMKAFPKMINPHRENQWLRDVVSAAYFAFVYYVGQATYYGASGAYGVRVVFGLKK